MPSKNYSALKTVGGNGTVRSYRLRRDLLFAFCTVVCLLCTASIYVFSSVSTAQTDFTFSLKKLIGDGLSQFHIVIEDNEEEDEESSFLVTEESSNSRDDCLCDGENFCFEAYLDGKSTSVGRRFDCKWKKYLDKFGLTTEAETGSIRRFEPEKVVIVTYASGNHFPESRLAIQKIRETMNNTIAFYDIGLNENQIAEVKSVCNVKYHRIDFDEYPRKTRKLFHYNFKAFIEADAYSRYPVYWMIDASLRFSHPDLVMDFYQRSMDSQDEQYQMRLINPHSIYFATHPGMYEWLPIDFNFAKREPMIKSGIKFVRRSPFSRENVKWSLLCALQPGCLAPKNSKRDCPKPTSVPDSFGKYANCHRYDQSALDIINSNLLERISSRKNRTDEWLTFLSVQRRTEMHKKLNIPCQ